jgi:hypothetical protein
MEYLEEFRRLVGTGPSYMERTSGKGRAMLQVLSKAFSRPVSLADIPYLRFRPFKNGVELKDDKRRLGGILTSVEGREAPSRVLMAFLSSYGAKGY